MWQNYKDILHMDSVNWIYLRAVIQIDRWHVFKDTHEGVYVSEDLKTTSCKDCNLSPKGSVKTKACSSTRLLIWVHIWEAGSQALTAPPSRGLCAYECVVTGLSGGKVLKPGVAVTSSSRSASVSVSHLWNPVLDLSFEKLVPPCWHSKWKYD